MNEPRTDWPSKWAGKTWKVIIEGGAAGVLTEELCSLYVAVPTGKEAMCKALGVPRLASRKADKALQLLRKAGFIYYEKGAWKRTLVPQT